MQVALTAIGDFDREAYSEMAPAIDTKFQRAQLRVLIALAMEVRAARLAMEARAAMGVQDGTAD